MILTPLIILVQIILHWLLFSYIRACHLSIKASITNLSHDITLNKTDDDCKIYAQDEIYRQEVSLG